MELTELQKQKNKLTRDITEISDNSGISFEMVTYVYKCIGKRLSINRSISALEIVFEVVENYVISNENVDISQSLIKHNIHSSSDIGLIVEQLCKKDLLKIERENEIEDFSGLFVSCKIDQFISLHKIKKPTSLYRVVSYICYGIGIVLVLGSYLDIVSNQIAWLGWAIGMFGWVLITFKERLSKFFSR